jgi:hypothetical protein
MASPNRAGSQKYLPKPIATLIILQGRTQLLREECEEAATAYAVEQEEENASLFSPTGFRLWTFLCLWLAYLYVLVEGYRNAYKHGFPLADPKVDSLLRSEYTEKLRRFRNKVFHPEAFNHEAIVVVLEDHAGVREWAGKVTDEVKRYLLAYAQTLSGPGAL